MIGTVNRKEFRDEPAKVTTKMNAWLLDEKSTSGLNHYMSDS
jgi:hypothetical protein